MEYESPNELCLQVQWDKQDLYTQFPGEWERDEQAPHLILEETDEVNKITDKKKKKTGWKIFDI